MSKIRVSGLVAESIVDGPGIRYVVFAQGCVHNCKGCHNPATHALDGGHLVEVDDIVSEIKKKCRYKYDDTKAYLKEINQTNIDNCDN